MRIGVTIFLTDQSIETTHLAEALEERGFDALWIPEHSHIPVSRKTPWGGRAGAPPLPERYSRTLDCFVALGAVAAVTDSLALGTGVTLVAQHDPIWLAKQVATLDTISNGRFIFGIEYGWNREEMAQHGVAYLDRRQIVEDKMRVIKALWTQDEASVDGLLEPSWASPKPVQKPHPPIFLGSAPGPKSMAAMARFCNGWMPIAGRYDIAAGIDLLREAFTAEGRDPAAARVTVYGTPDDQADWKVWEDLGVEGVTFNLPSGPAEVVIPLLDEYRAHLG